MVRRTNFISLNIYNLLTMAKETPGIKIIAVNKKASFNYFLSDFLECGIALLGTEIKSLRVHGASLGHR